MNPQQWVVIVELNRPAEDLEDDDLVEEILDDLTDAAPALAASPDGWLQITITLPATSLRQAIAMALPRIETHGEPTMLSALPETVRDAHEGIPPIPELVSMAEAAALLGVSRQAVLGMTDAGKLHYQQVGNTRVTTRAAAQALAETRARQGIKPRGPAPRATT